MSATRLQLKMYRLRDILEDDLSKIFHINEASIPAVNSVSLEEFKFCDKDKEIKIGDKIDIYVERLEAEIKHIMNESKLLLSEINHNFIESINSDEL